MKHNSDLDKFLKQLIKKKFDAEDEQIDKIVQYCSLIKQWSRRINLVSRHDLDHLVERHVIPSAFVADIVRIGSAQRIADIGAGAGFPGIIIKLLLPQRSVCLIDSSRKKSLFLLELCEIININCQVINERIEDVGNRMAGRYDLIVSRALAPLSSIWSWSEKLLVEAGSIFALKGGHLGPEIKELDKMNLNIKIVEPEPEWRSWGNSLRDKVIVCVRRDHGK